MSIRHLVQASGPSMRHPTRLPRVHSSGLARRIRSGNLHGPSKRSRATMITNAYRRSFAKWSATNGDCHPYSAHPYSRRMSLICDGHIEGQNNKIIKLLLIAASFRPCHRHRRPWCSAVRRCLASPLASRAVTRHTRDARATKTIVRIFLSRSLLDGDFDA